MAKDEDRRQKENAQDAREISEAMQERVPALNLVMLGAGESTI